MQIQKMRPGLLRDNNLEKFKGAFIDGDVFVDHAGDVEFFENKCKLPIGISERLAKLARGVTGGETAGIKSRFQQANNVIGNRQQAGDAEMSDTASKSLLPIQIVAQLVTAITGRGTADIKSKFTIFIHAHYVDCKLTGARQKCS